MPPLRVIRVRVSARASVRSPGFFSNAQRASVNMVAMRLSGSPRGGRVQRPGVVGRKLILNHRCDGLQSQPATSLKNHNLEELAEFAQRTISQPGGPRRDRGVHKPPQCD